MRATITSRSAGLPVGWRMAPLRELVGPVEQKRGGLCPEPAVLSCSKIHGILRQSDKFGKRVASADTSKYLLVQRGDYVYDPMLAWDGSVGRQEIVDLGIVSPAYEVFRANDDVDPGWLARRLRSEETVHSYWRLSEGTNVRRKTLPFEYFAQIEVPTPPRAEQSRIAKVLDAAEEAVRMQREHAASAGCLQTGLLGSLIDDDWRRSTRASMRMPLASVAEIRRGYSWSKSQEYKSPSPERTRVIGIRNVQEQLVLDDILYLGDVAPRDLVRKSLPSGWSLMVASNGNPNRVGNCVQQPVDGVFLFASFLIGIGPKTNSLLPDYLHLLLRSPRMQREISRNVQGSTGLSNLNLDLLSRALIPVPPLDRQVEVVSVIQAAFLVTEEATNGLLHSKNVRAGLSRALLTGAIRVEP